MTVPLRDPRRFSWWRGVVVMLGAIIACSLGRADDRVRSGAGSANFSGSLTNEQDRTAEQLLQAAERDFQAGETASGLGRLQELFERESDSFVLVGNVYQQVAVRAGAILRDGPAERIATYRRLYGPLAREALEKAAGADDEAAIQRVARSYRFTNAGQEAALHLAVLALDRGETEAAAKWRRWVEGEAVPAMSGFEESELLTRLSRLIAARWATEAVNENENASAIDLASLPSSSSFRWRERVPMTSEARREIAASLSELDAQAVIPLMSARPLMLDGVAYSRRIGGIVAVDIATGALLWIRTIPTPVSRLLDETTAFTNSMRRSTATAMFLERLVRSSLTDHLSTDGVRIFVIIPGRDSEENTLLALAADDGKLLWRLGEEVPSDDRSSSGSAARSANQTDEPEETETPGYFFMGPPQNFGRWRILTGQRANIVSLLAFDAENGNLAWSVPLGQAVRALEEDKPRHGTACPVKIVDGRAYCPTAAGSLACVDLPSRQLLWAFRYPRDDLPRAARDEFTVRPDTTHATHMPTRETWHGVFLEVEGDRVIFASPDSDLLYALDKDHGYLRWSTPRGRGLYLTGPVDDRVLIVGTSTAAARHVIDGEILWTAEISRPAGTGFDAGSAYVIPTQAGRLETINWKDGSKAVGSATAKEDGVFAKVGDDLVPIQIGPSSKLRPLAMHNVVATGETVLMQSFFQIASLEHATTDRPESEDRLDVATNHEGNSPTPDSVIGTMPFLEAEQLRVAEPLSVLLRATAPKAAAVLTTARVIGQLSPHVRAPDELAAELLTQLAEAISRDDSSEVPSAEAIAIWRRLKRQPLDRLYVEFDDPRRSVRLDHWLQHGFARMAGDLPELQDMFSELVNDDFLPASKGQRSNAAPSQKVGQQTARGSTILSSWPSGEPTVTEEPTHGGNLYVNNVPLTIIRDSPWEHVTVQIDRTEQNLWFHRADQTSPVTMPLPRSQYGQMPLEFLHAWADGPLLCLRVGTDLFGFWLPHDDSELPTAPTWPRNGQTRSIAGERPPFTMALNGTNDDPRPLWDDSIPGYFDNFSRPYGMMGPVREAYFCHHDRGNLVAVESTTGEELWSRSGLAVGTYAVGDDEHIVLLRDDAQTVEVLRSVDGEKIAEWNWHDVIESEDATKSAFSHLVAVRGTLGLWHSHPPQRQQTLALPDTAPADVEVKVIDLVTGRVLWSSAASPETWFFTIDNRRVGRLSPDGQLALMDWETGTVAAAHTISVPARITSVLVFTDAEAAYIVVTDRPDDRRLFGEQQIRKAERRPLVNGWMHAVDRTTDEHRWQQELSNVGLILDQPRHIPLLITSYMMRDEDSNHPRGMLLCYDRRTGKLLHEQRGQQAQYLYHAIRSNSETNSVEVETPVKTVRFQYASGE